MASLLIALEKIFTIASLVFYSGGPLAVILNGGHSQGDGSGEIPQDYPLMRLIFIATYIVFAVLLIVRWEKTWVVIRRDRFTLLLAIFTVSSLFWSATPDETLSKSIAFVGSTLFGIYLATRYTLKQQIEILAYAFSIVIGLSFFYGLALPQYGIMGGVHQGDWRGIYSHKNTLGKQMVLSAATFLTLALNSQQKSWKPLFGLLASVVLIALCTSKGAMINLSILLATGSLCYLLRWQLRFLVPTLMGGITLGTISFLWIMNHLEEIAAFLKKDLTLTGRTDIWSLVFDMIQKKPWFGYGYFGFWNGWDSDAAYVWRAFNWDAPNAHNGFIDTWVQLGFVGLALFLLGLYFHLLHSLLQLRCTSEPEYIWPVLLFVYVIFSNLPESNALQPNDLFWVLYVSTTLQGYRLTQRSYSTQPYSATAHAL